MRKFTLFIASLFIAIGAMAQSVVTAINTEKYYTLECCSGVAHSTTRFIGVTDAGVIDGHSSAPAYVTFEAGEAENSYYIKVGEKYINYDGTQLSASTDKSTAWILGTVGQTVTFKVPETTLYLNNNGTVADATITNLKANNHGTSGPTADNACSTWQMCEYDEKIMTAPERFINGKVYTFVTSRGAMGASDTSDNAISTARITADTETDYFKWTVYRSEKNNYYIYNIGKGLFLGEQSTTGDASVPMSETPAKVTFKTSNLTAYPLMFKTTDNESCVINHSSSHGDGLITWNGGWSDLNDTGNGHKVIEVSELDATILETVAAAVTELESKPIVAITYSVTDVAGNVYTGTYDGYEGETLPTFNGVVGYSFTDAVWDGTNYTAKINFNFPVSSKEKDVTNEVLFNVKNQSAKLLRTSGEQVKVTTETADANCSWAVYPSFNNGSFTFTIMNIATGKYIYSEQSGSKLDKSDNSNTGADGVISLSETGSVFTYDSNGSFYGFKFADGRSATYLSINSPANDTDVDLGIHNGIHGGTDFVATSVPAYPVTITEAKYATFYAPYAVSVPEGVTAHAVTINGEWATLGDALDIIPAYTGVVLYSETANTYTFPVTTTENVVESDLRGTVATTYVADDAYVLANGDNSIGFYLAEMNNADKTAFLNNHHKAYLPKPTGAENVACYSFRFDGTTGVEKVEIRNEKEEIYDLTGRRVNSMNAAGIYIVNGKKVLVK